MNFILGSRKMASLVFAVFVFALAAPPAMAACSEAKVKRLAKQGKTVANIARTCDMSKDEVKEIVDERGDSETDASDAEPSGQRLAPGTPLAACACYGRASPQYREPNAECRSGFARPRACSQPCYGGGFAWQGVCG